MFAAISQDNYYSCFSGGCGGCGGGGGGVAETGIALPLIAVSLDRKYIRGQRNRKDEIIH